MSQVLSDEEIDVKVDSHFLKFNNLTPHQWRSYARAIESAACADRDARIAELERELAEAQKDTQIIRNQALEDAAVLCDEKSNAHDIQGKTFILKDLVDCAHAIRSMKKEQQ